MAQHVETFVEECEKAFQFLEHVYGYRHLEKVIQYKDYPLDTTIQCRYVGSRVGVQISWALSDLLLWVEFVELLQEHDFPAFLALYPQQNPRVAKVIQLSDLARVISADAREDTDFLLREQEDYLPWDEKKQSLKEHDQILNERMPEVLAGLARATRRYASDVLDGDTSIFPKVMEYYVMQQKKIHPRIRFP